MRRLTRGVLITLGLLLGLILLVGGIGAAAYVGSDDIVFGKPTRLSAGAAVTAPDVFAFNRLHLIVRAKGDGAVFIGRANPVDVASLTKGRKVFEITRTQRSGSTGALHDGKALPALGSLDVWQDSASGPDEQELVADIDGEPTQFVIASTGRPSLTIAFGVRLHGLYVRCLLVALAGLLLLLLTIGLWWWTRRRRAGAPTGYPKPLGPPPSAPPPGVRRGAAVVGALALLVPLAGCSAVPDIPDEVAVPKATKVALTKDQVASLWADYDRRNNAAIKLAGKGSWKLSGWAKADTGPLLAGDQFDTKYDQLTKNAKASSKPITHQPGRVWAPTMTSYPLWAVVEDRVKGDKASKFVVVDVMTRQTATSPWLERGDAAISTKDLALLTPDGQPADKGDAARFATVEKKILSYWASGVRHAPVAATGNLAFPWSNCHDEEKDDYVARCDAHALAFDDHSTRILSVAGGAVAFADYTLTFHIFAKDGASIFWKKPFDRLWSSFGDDEIDKLQAATLAIYLPDRGKPRVLGASYRDMAAYDLTD